MVSSILILLVVAIWGAIHSFLASLTWKNALEKRFGLLYKKYYRLFFVVFGGSSFILVLAAVIFLPDRLLYVIPLPWVVLTCLLQLAGALLVLYSIAQTGAFVFLGLSQAFDPQSIDKTVPFVTEGAFKFVRHPIYSGSFLVIWLFPYMSQNILAFNVGATLYILVGIILEERKLVAEFGERYIAYRKNTPMLIPFTRR